MAKRKKQRKRQHSPRRPPARLMHELAAAMELYEDGEIVAARQQLLLLNQKYPRSKPVLLALLEVSYDIEDWRTCAYFSEQLLSLESGEDRAETLNNMVYAYIQLMYPALAWHYATELVTQHPDFKYSEKNQSFVEIAESFLLEQVEDTMALINLPQDEKLELLILHDRVRFYTESGYPEDAIRVAEALLENAPNIVPVLNNLSLAQFMIGDVEQAIVTAQKVITQEPHNFHALSNLVRCYYLTAQFDQAQAYAARLQQISSDNPDLEVKQAEAFAYLGDDEKVWAAYEQAKAKHNELFPLLYHLAAVAAYRLGNEKTAWQLWRQAGKLFPSFDLAVESLAEKQLPIGERDVPWYWPFQYWFPMDIRQLIEKHLGKNIQRMSEKDIKQAVSAFLAERPYLTQLFPHMLERGDRETRQFVLNFMRIVETSELLQQLYDFALGRYGADDQRMEAMQFIIQNYPDMLPDNKLAPMWIEGRQGELLMLSFEITDEPEGIEGISEEILEKHEVAVDLLMNDETKAAELLLHEIIAEEPDFYSAYNHLALAYEKQGKIAESRALVTETHARFPDYLFARAAVARIMAQEKRIKEARELLAPLLRLKKLHISEFRALARAEMDIDLADNKPEAARSWLEMWEEMEEDNPELSEWERRIEAPSLIQGIYKLLARSQEGKRLRRK